jgi:hypothetical protein
MAVFGSSVYGVHAARGKRYPLAARKRDLKKSLPSNPSMGARVSGALQTASHAAHAGIEAAKSIPIGFPLVALAALGAVFGGTLWGWKGFGAGAGLGLLAGYGVSKLPDNTSA